DLESDNIDDEESLGYEKIEKIYNNKKYSHEPSLNDYNELDPFEAKMYDNRSFWTIYLDTIKNKHELLTIFLKKSLLPTMVQDSKSDLQFEYNVLFECA